MRTIAWKTLVPADHVAHIAVAELPARACVDAHGHDFMEVYWVRGGTVENRVNGLTHRMQMHDLAWLLPSDRHSLFAPETGGVVAMNVAFPAAVGRRLCHAHAPDLVRHPASRNFRLDVREADALARLAERLAEAPANALLLECFLLEVLAARLRARASVPVADDTVPGWLEAAMREYRTPAHFHTGPAGFARLCGKSHPHVARTVRAVLGSRVSDVVNGIRMRWAARMLAATNEPIAAIALESGFESLGRFYQVFVAAHGMPPRKYRLRARATVASRGGDDARGNLP